MTFERLNRVGHDGGPLWRMDVGGHGNRFQKQLIVEPYSSPNPDRGAELQVWFEERRARYHWVSDDPKRRPATPTWSADYVEVPNSRRTEVPKLGLEYVVIKALACSDLHGDSAASAVHNLFWMHFIEDDDGLHYLCKYAEKDIGNFYARERLLRYLRYDDSAPRRERNYRVTGAIEDAMKERNAALGERFCRTAMTDLAVRDAIDAMLLTSEPPEVQHDNIRKLVELNASRMDHVIAAVTDATRGEHALLGLRACQRAERDPEFFTALDAFVLAHSDGRGMISFLKPHCKRPKPVKLAAEETEEEIYDD